MKLVSDVFVTHNGKILILKASYRTNWQFPGGHVDPGETPHDAAQREAVEETGPSITVGKTPLCIHVERNTNGQADALCFLFPGVYDENIAVQVDQHEIVDYQWVTPDVAQTLLNPLVALLVPYALKVQATNQTIYIED